LPSSASDPAGDRLTNNRLRLGRFMHLTGGHFDRQRSGCLRTRETWLGGPAAMPLCRPQAVR
jgi:hypothetical protein